MRRPVAIAMMLAMVLAVPPAAAAAMPFGTHDGPEGLQSQNTCAAWGWAVDPDDPSRAVTVRVLVDGVEVARVVASQHRQDLVDAGVSPSGDAAFDVPLWNLVSHDVWHAVRVEAKDLDSDGWAAINLTPRRIACHAYTLFEYDLFVADMATGVARQLTTTKGRGDWNADWSPSGSLVAHDVVLQDPSGVGGLRSYIGVTSLATGRTRAVSGSSGGNDAAWNPGAGWLAFDRLSVNDRSIYLIPQAGGTRRLVRRNAVSADFAPSGKRLVFFEPSASRIMSVDLRGGDPVAVARLRSPVSRAASFYDVNPEWSPDGRWIAYADGGHIWKVRVGSRGQPLAVPVRVTSGRALASGPSWGPGAATIVFQARYEGESDIWSVTAAGGIPVKLTAATGLAGFGDFNGALSPAGDRLVFSSPTTVVPAELVTP